MNTSAYSVLLPVANGALSLNIKRILKDKEDDHEKVKNTLTHYIGILTFVTRCRSRRITSSKKSDDHKKKNENTFSTTRCKTKMGTVLNWKIYTVTFDFPVVIRVSRRRDDTAVGRDVTSSSTCSVQTVTRYINRLETFFRDERCTAKELQTSFRSIWSI